MTFLKNTDRQVFLAITLGILLGIFVPQSAAYFEIFGEIFIQLLKMVIFPLVFASIFLAVVRPSHESSLGKLGLYTTLYFLTTTAIASLTGVLTSFIFPNGMQLQTAYETPTAPIAEVSARSMLLHLIPSNPIQSFANGDILQIIVFTLFFGVAVSKIDRVKRESFVKFMEVVEQAMMSIIRTIVMISPIGIFALTIGIVSKTNAQSLLGLGWFFAAVGIAAFFHILITLSGIGMVLGRFHPYKFIVHVRDPLVVAFSTSSSMATIPVSTRTLEVNEKVRPEIAGFMIPLGATLNMNGSALYQALVVIFVGKILGMDFHASQLFLVFFMITLFALCTPGVPGGGIMGVTATFQMLGIPMEWIGLYLLVDRFCDPVVTITNVLGNLFGAKTMDSILKRRHLFSAKVSG